MEYNHGINGLWLLSFKWIIDHLRYKNDSSKCLLLDACLVQASSELTVIPLEMGHLSSCFPLMPWNPIRIHWMRHCAHVHIPSPSHQQVIACEDHPPVMVGSTRRWSRRVSCPAVSWSGAHHLRWHVPLQRRCDGPLIMKHGENHGKICENRRNIWKNHRKTWEIPKLSGSLSGKMMGLFWEFSVAKIEKDWDSPATTPMVGWLHGSSHSQSGLPQLRLWRVHLDEDSALRGAGKNGGSTLWQT